MEVTYVGPDTIRQTITKTVSTVAVGLFPGSLVGGATIGTANADYFDDNDLDIDSDDREFKADGDDSDVELDDDSSFKIDLD